MVGGLGGSADTRRVHYAAAAKWRCTMKPEIGRNAVIGDGVKFGEGVIVGDHVWIGEGVVIEDRVHIAPHAMIPDFTSLPADWNPPVKVFLLRDDSREDEDSFEPLTFLPEGEIFFLGERFQAMDHLEWAIVNSDETKDTLRRMGFMDVGGFFQMVTIAQRLNHMWEESHFVAHYVA
jgi:hypothetical protein